MKILKIFLSIFILQACAHDKILDVSKTYKKTLKFQVEGENAIGTISVKKRQSYRLIIDIPQNPNFVKITSCHQERIFIKPGKEIYFVYRPDPDLEAGELPCLTEISVIEASGKNQWGLLDFRLNHETLNARVQCNGDTIKNNGSYICQSRRDLIQSIYFENEVSVYYPEECNKIEPKQGKTFYFSMTEGLCFYIFSDKDKNLYRLITFGYNDVLMD